MTQEFAYLTGIASRPYRGYRLSAVSPVKPALHNENVVEFWGAGTSELLR